MENKKKKSREKSNYEIYQSIRRDWGEIKPYSKIYRSAAEYNRHSKHPYDYQEDLFEDFVDLDDDDYGWMGI